MENKQRKKTNGKAVSINGNGGDLQQQITQIHLFLLENTLSLHNLGTKRIVVFYPVGKNQTRDDSIRLGSLLLGDEAMR